MSLSQAYKTNIFVSVVWKDWKNIENLLQQAL